METHELIASLRSVGVETVIIGGIAMRLHASARVTQDLDLVVRALDTGTAVRQLYAIGYVLVRDVTDDGIEAFRKAEAAIQWVDTTKRSSMTFVAAPTRWLKSAEGNGYRGVGFVSHGEIRVESQVDVLCDLAVPFTILKRDAFASDVDGVLVHYASPDHLIALKEARSDRSAADEADLDYLRSL